MGNFFTSSQIFDVEGVDKHQFIDKNVFCFDKKDLIEFKKNNWQIDDGYMLRVFFDGKNINFEGASKPVDKSL